MGNFKVILLVCAILIFSIFASSAIGAPVSVYPSDVAPVVVVPGQTGVAMIRFYLLAPAGSSATWDQVTVARIGLNSADATVSAVRVYQSANAIFDGGDTQIGTGTFSGGSVTINITDQAITDAVTNYYFIVYDIAGGASTSANIGARLNADAFIFVSPGSSSGDNLPFESTGSDIGVGGSTMGSISAVKNDCDTMTATFTYTGDENFNSSTKFEYNTTNTWPGTTACGSVSGTSPRTCAITGLNLSANSYYVRVTQTDVDGISGTNPLVSAQIASGCGSSFVPVVSIVAPPSGTRVAGNATYPYKIQASVWEPEDANPLADTVVQVSIDGGAWTNMARNANYDDAGNRYYIYEYNWAPGNIGVHVISVRATDSGSNIGYATPNVWVYGGDIAASVDTAGEVFKGEGNLLVRTNSSQICNDCHNLPNHGSGGMESTSYGSWQLDCRDCHSPHAGGNIYLVNSSINTPNSGSKAVTFQSVTNFVDNAAPRDGICEVCHTKTKYYRNDGTQPQAHNKDTQNCTGCHPHTKAFKPSESSGGSSCCSCHSDLWAEMNSTNNYHHYLNNCEVTNVASSGTKYPSDRQPGATTDEDRRCLVCHADHDIFRPDLNPEATRATNLRTSMGEQPSASTDVGFVNTDYGYTRGTATFTNGSATVTGAETNWQSGMAGWYIRSDNYDLWYQVSTVDNATQITLASTYAGANYTGGYVAVSQDNISSNRAYKSGRVSFTSGSATVTGTGTKWLDNISTGWRIIPLAGNNLPWYTVNAVNSDTQLTLTANAGATLTNVMYIAASSIYTTGTVAVTNNNTSVTGTGTTWLNTVQPGWKFRVDTNGNWYTVASVASDTSLTLTTAYFGSTASGQAYTLYAAGNPTANFTNGSTTVTGNGTSWPASMNGWYIKNDSNGVWYLINSVSSATQITLSSAYAGATMSGASFTSLPASPSGICGSCHYNMQSKSYAQPDGTTQTPIINLADYKRSSHEYKVTSTFGTDSSTFYANCSKCHNDTMSPKSSFNAQTSTYKFGNHQSILRRILAPLGILSPADPLEESFCYQCHTGGTAGNDYYGASSMTASARSLQRQFTELWGTSTGGNTTTTLNDTAKNWVQDAFARSYVTVTSGPLAGQIRMISANTATRLTVLQAWASAPGNETYKIGSWHEIQNVPATRHAPIEGQTSNWNPASDRHIQCEDCHNPHSAVRGGSEEREPESGGANRGTWGVVPSYSAIYNTGTASFSNSATTVNGTGTTWTAGMVGQWIRCYETATGQTDYLGRWYRITARNSDTQLVINQPYEAPKDRNNNSIAMNNCRYAIAGITFQRVEEAGRQSEVCFKCHSNYGYDDLPGNIPDFPALNTNFGSNYTVVFETKPGTDSALEFNPNQLGFHPVMGVGNNRPAAGTNGNWSSSAGRKRIPGTTNTYNDISNTFVDGWEFTSIVTCNDCHESRAAADPQGPHGSANQWILKGVDRNVSVTIADGTVVSVNNTTNIPAGWESDRYFCYNCHRWDVYDISATGSGAPYYRNLSRINHPPDGRTDTFDTGPNGDDRHTVWGIGCMHCHGGDSPGGMHGSNRGIGEGTTPQGRRLLNGATWTGITAGAAGSNPTCFTIDNTDTRYQRLSICTDHTSGRTGGNSFNYTYP
ncbi:MAG TPA: hypothetical protein VII00_04555 [bacterium]